MRTSRLYSITPILRPSSYSLFFHNCISPDHDVSRLRRRLSGLPLFIIDARQLIVSHHIGILKRIGLPPATIKSLYKSRTESGVSKKISAVLGVTHLLAHHMYRVAPCWGGVHIDRQIYDHQKRQRWIIQAYPEVRRAHVARLGTLTSTVTCGLLDGRIFPISKLEHLMSRCAQSPQMCAWHINAE